MYPINDATLTFSEIARHWIRNPPQGVAESEIVDKLLSAFWDGEFEGQATIGDYENKFSRETALKALANQKEQPGVLFLTQEEDEGRPWQKDLEGSGNSADLRQRIIVPADGSWTTPLAFKAYAGLAKASCDDFDSNLGIYMRMISLDAASFRSWRVKNRQTCDWWESFVTDETAAERKQRLHEWFEEDCASNGKTGAKNRVAEREGITRQTLSGILDRQE